MPEFYLIIKTVPATTFINSFIQKLTLDRKKIVIITPLRLEIEVDTNVNIQVVDYKNFEKLLDILKEQAEADAFIFLHSQYLTGQIETNNFTLPLQNLKLNFASHMQLNWDDYVKKVINIENSTNADIFIFLYTEFDCIENIVEKFSAVDIDINTIVGKNDSITINSIFEILNAHDYESAVIEIDKIKLTSISKAAQASVLLNIKYNRIDEAIHIIETVLSDDLNYRKLLSDLYYEKGAFENSFSELSRMNTDGGKYISGYYESIVRVATKLNLKESVKWIEEALNSNPTGQTLLETAANYYNRNQLYDKAIECRTRLFHLSNDPLHLLLSKILEFRKSPPTKSEFRKNHFQDILESYPELFNEYHYRLGSLWQKHYRSYYQAYNHFSKVSIKIGDQLTLEAALARKKLLTDHVVIKEIFKSMSKDRVIKMLANELVASIPIFALQPNGYYIWRDFIDKTSAKQNWEVAFKEKLLTDLKACGVESLKAAFGQSYLQNVIGAESPVNFLRQLKITTEVSGVKLEEIVSGVIASCKTIKEELWVRYELALLFVFRNKFQLGNDICLSIWALAGC